MRYNKEVNNNAVAFGIPKSHGCIFNVPQAGGFFTCSFVNFWVRFHTITTKNKPEKIGAEQEDIMAEQQFIMTQKGYDEAVERLKYLQTVKRQEIVERISEARSHGDLSENAEYDAARNEQAANEGEIADLDYKIKNAVIVENIADTSFVHIGSKVKVYDEELDEEDVYEITGTTEADPMANKISNESPVGAALLKRKVGDTVKIVAPDGEYKLTIKEIF
jgi:transcription elongation factor GreA